MQDCSKGVMVRTPHAVEAPSYCVFMIYQNCCFQDMTYDLGDAARWEFLFPTMDKPLLGLPAMDEGNLDLDDEEVRQLT